MTTPLVLNDLNTPEAQKLAVEEDEQLQRAFDEVLLELHPQTRDLVLYVDRDEMTMAEAARRVGLTSPQARYRYEQAHNLLAQRLRARGIQPRRKSGRF